MAHFIRLGLGAIMSRLVVEDRTKPGAAHECDHQFGEKETADIGKSQRLRKEGNARINKVMAMRLGSAKIIEQVHNSTYFESLETDISIEDNVCCIDYADTWSSK
jgi:hypothetical protein